MKAFTTLLIVLLFGVIAQAQSEITKTPSPKRVDSHRVISETTKSFDSIKVNTLDYVFLSKFKNTRVKKALLFVTRNDKAKMA